MQAACDAISSVDRRVKDEVATLPKGASRVPSGTVTNAAGERQHVDTLFSILAEGLYNTLFMLAGREKWFDQREKIVLPSSPSTGELKSDLAFQNLHLASLWTLLQQADEHLRYFGGEVACYEHHSNQKTYRVVDFDFEVMTRRFETIALERLDKLLTQWYMTARLEADHTLGIVSRGSAQLAPINFISRDERLAAEAFAGLLHFDLTANLSTKYPLCLAEWLRGYSVLRRRCYASELEVHFSFVRINRADLLDELVECGLTPSNAAVFISECTLGKGKRDLYDAPLIQDDQGYLHMFAPLTSSGNLIHIITSQLSSIGVDTEVKGEAAEVELRSIFMSQNIPVAEAKYVIGDKHYQCDALVLWEGHLFVFEVKNRLIPLGTSAIYSHRFWKQLQEDCIQCKRIASDIEANPSILRKYFGESASFHSLHAVLVQVMPFAIDYEISGVMCFDFSALSRFFNTPELSIDVHRVNKSGLAGVTKFVVGDLWTSDRPTPSDLLRAIQNPTQIKTTDGNWNQVFETVRLSDDVVMRVPNLERVPDDYGDFLRALGWSKDQIGQFDEIRRRSTRS